MTGSERPHPTASVKEVTGAGPHSTQSGWRVTGVFGLVDDFVKQLALSQWAARLLLLPIAAIL